MQVSQLSSLSSLPSTWNSSSLKHLLQPMIDRLQEEASFKRDGAHAIEPSAYIISKGRIGSWTACIDWFLQNKESHVLLVTGKSGIGKTFIAKQTALTAWQDPIEPRLFMYVSCKELKEPLQSLEQVFSHYGIDFKKLEVQKTLQARDIVIILDDCQIQYLADSIETLSQEWPHIKWILTFDQSQSSSLTKDFPQYSACQLLPFHRAQVFAYLHTFTKINGLEAKEFSCVLTQLIERIERLKDYTLIFNPMQDESQAKGLNRLSYPASLHAIATNLFAAYAAWIKSHPEKTALDFFANKQDFITEELLGESLQNVDMTAIFASLTDNVEADNVCDVRQAKEVLRACDIYRVLIEAPPLSSTAIGFVLKQMTNQTLTQ